MKMTMIITMNTSMKKLSMKELEKEAQEKWQELSIPEHVEYYMAQGMEKIEAMKAAAAELTGTHDFKAFSDNKRMKKSTVRTVSDIDIYASESEITITVTGDDFWPNMVRNLVGTVLSAGLGEIKAEEIPDIIASGDRERIGRVVDPKGLFLADVKYA